MLERVSLSQPRFATPGLALDSRGVALGPRGVALFGGLDRLVRFLRAYSQESGFDDLGQLQIVEVRSKVGVRQHALTVQLVSSYVADRVARLARLFGGQLYVGERRHFVQYRDPGAPLGYDVQRLTEEDADLLLYSESTVHVLATVRTTDFVQMLLRLELQPQHLTEDELKLDVVYVVVRGAVGERLLSHLYRRGVKMEAGFLPRRTDAVFADRLGDLVVRASGLRPSLVRLLRATPGCLVFVPVLDNVLVELGWQYPLRLPSLGRWLQGERLFFFSGTRRTVDVVEGGLRLTQGELLVEGPAGGEATIRPAQVTGLDKIAVALRLVESSTLRRPFAALVPWARAADLRRLVFALPPPLLAGLRAVALESLGVLVVGTDGIGLMPGDLFVELAPKVLVPLGHELAPRVDSTVLQDTLIAGRSVLALLRSDGPPVLVDEPQLRPLGRSLLAGLALAPAPVRSAVDEPSAGTVINEPPPWWGFVR